MKLVRLTRRPDEVVEISDNEFADFSRWGLVLEVVETSESVDLTQTKSYTSKARS
jgi:hypothetical protein